MFAIRGFLFLIVAFCNTLISQAQVPCPSFNEMVERNTAWVFPNFDRSRNTLFSRLYIESYGDSIEGVDLKTQRRLAEHMLITGMNEEALTLLKLVNREQCEEALRNVRTFGSETWGLLANAYQVMGKLDSALLYAQRMGAVGDDSTEYGSRFVQMKILKARLRAAGRSEWIEHHNVLELNSHMLDSGTLEKNWTQIGSLTGFAWELSDQARLTRPPDRILARAFEEVADVTARISIQRATILYYVAMQYDPENALGIAEKFEQNNNYAEQCGVKVPDAETLTSIFPPLHEVSEVEYQYHDDLKRVLTFQEMYAARKTRDKYVLLIVPALMAIAIWYLWRRFKRGNKENAA